MGAASPSPPVDRRPRFRFGDFTLDLDSGFLSRDGEEIRLRPKSFEVLTYLVQRHGKLVTKDELVRAVWANVIVTDNSLAQCLVEIRRALDDDEQQIIRTVARRGYLFAAPIAEWPAPGSLSHTVTEQAGRSTAVRGLALAGVAAAVVAAGWAAQRMLFGAPALEYTLLTDISGSVLAPALSSDGRMVAFVRGEDHFLSPGNQIWVKLLPNGEPIRLTNDSRLKYAPTFSPDGAYVAYSVLDSSGWNTYRVPSLGGEPQLFLQNASGLTWLADGRLLFSAQRGSIHMGIVAATPTRADERDVYWPAHQRGMAHFSYPSPDGRWALVIEMDHHPNWLPCRLVPIEGSSPGREVGPGGACTAAGWSPDGEWMYFTVELDGHGRLWRQRFPAGKPEQLTFGPAEAQGVAVDPGGRSLITSLGLRRNELWVRDAHGERPLSTQGTVAWWFSLSGSLGWSSVPSFSRDGRYLYYPYRPEPSASGFALWRTELATGRSEAVTELPVSEYDVSPDGAEVVFSTEGADGGVEIWRASTDKTFAPRRIVAGDVATPQFGADGRVLFRQTEGTLNRLRWMSADGSAHGNAVPFPIATLQTVSPDGRSAVAILQGGASFLFPIDADGAPVKLCGGCYAQWSPDGRWLYVTPTGSKQTLALPVEHGASAPQIPSGGLRSADDHALVPGAVVLDMEFVSPGLDPSTYAYVKTSLQRNLYRVQLD